MRVGVDINILRDYIPKLVSMYFKEHEKDPNNDEINPYGLEDSFDDEIFDFIGENCLEIFGFAKESERGVIGFCGMLQEKYPEHTFYIICNGWKMIVPATLHFLSKMSCNVLNYVFRQNSIDLWENIDIIITDSPFLLKNKPEGKKIVKINKFYNTDLVADYNIENLTKIEDEGIF